MLVSGNAGPGLRRGGASQVRPGRRKPAPKNVLGFYVLVSGEAGPGRAGPGRRKPSRAGAAQAGTGRGGAGRARIGGTRGPAKVILLNASSNGVFCHMAEGPGLKNNWLKIREEKGQVGRPTRDRGSGPTNRFRLKLRREPALWRQIGRGEGSEGWIPLNGLDRGPHAEITWKVPCGMPCLCINKAAAGSGTTSEHQDLPSLHSLLMIGVPRKRRGVLGA